MGTVRIAESRFRTRFTCKSIFYKLSVNMPFRSERDTNTRAFDAHIESVYIAREFFSSVFKCLKAENINLTTKQMNNLKNIVKTHLKMKESIFQNINGKAREIVLFRHVEGAQNMQ